MRPQQTDGIFSRYSRYESRASPPQTTTPRPTSTNHRSDRTAYPTLNINEPLHYPLFDGHSNFAREALVRMEEYDKQLPTPSTPIIAPGNQSDGTIKTSTSSSSTGTSHRTATTDDQTPVIASKEVYSQTQALLAAVHSTPSSWSITGRDTPFASKNEDNLALLIRDIHQWALLHGATATWLGQTTMATAWKAIEGQALELRTQISSGSR